MTGAIQAIFPHANPGWIPELLKTGAKHGIDTPNEIASCMAQLGHESAGFTRFEENLHYSVVRLSQVWKRFARNPNDPQATRTPNDLAYKYASKPEALANFIYANRLGNGDEASGDGWRFRGRGPIQLTGRRNYADCLAATGIPVLTYPDLLLLPSTGSIAACWYWRVHRLDTMDDDDDVLAETKAINGGTTGLAERQKLFDKLLEVLG